jgi:hypothetical protein
MPIRFDLTGCTVLGNSFLLTRRPNEPDELDVTVHLASGWGQARDLLGRRVELRVTGEGDRIASFTGTVVRVRRRGRQDNVELRVLGSSAAMDVVRRSRCFSSAAGDPVSICDLPALREQYPGVEGLERLTARVATATQLDETDWRFLVRNARLSDALLLDGERVKVKRENDGPTRALAAGDLVEDATLEECCAAGPGIECLTADEATGAVAAQAAVGHVPGGDVPPADRHRHTLAAPLPGDDQGRADALAGALAAGEQVLTLALRDPSVGPGCVIRLPDGATDFVVRSSTILFDPARAVDPLINHVECHAGRRLHPAPPDGRRGIRTFTGQVCEVLAGDRQMRVRVTPPWHFADRCGDPATWPGLWCRVPQSAGGSAGAPHGAMHVPPALDWADVSYDLDETGLARVTGAVSNENSSLVGPQADPAADVVLVRTADGRDVSLRKQPRTIQLVVAASGEPDRVQLRLILGGEDGCIRIEAPDGKVEIVAAEANVHAENVLTLSAARVEVRRP